MLALSNKNWEYLERWMFLTVAGRQNFRQTGGKFTKFDQMTRRLEREALNAYDDLLNDADTPSPVSDLVKTFCSHSHPSLMGLIEGLDVERPHWPRVMETLRGRSVLYSVVCVFAGSINNQSRGARTDSTSRIWMRK